MEGLGSGNRTSCRNGHRCGRAEIGGELIGDRILDSISRIAVIGSPGAGKSTLAGTLSGMLGIPIRHLDTYYWQPNWTPTPSEEWIPLAREIASQDRWIIDGNYSSTFDVRLPRADLIIWLDYSRARCLFRAFYRALRYRNSRRPDMAEGCREEFDSEFYRYIWDFPGEQRDRIIRWLGKPEISEKSLIFTSPRQTRLWLRKLSSRNRSVPPHLRETASR